MVAPLPRLIFLALLLLITACGTAEDFSDDVALIKTETVESDDEAKDAVPDQGNKAADSAASVAADPATDQTPSGDQPTRRVLEVTPETATAPATDGAAAGSSTGTGAEPSTVTDTGGTTAAPTGGATGQDTQSVQATTTTVAPAEDDAAQSSTTIAPANPASTASPTSGAATNPPPTDPPATAPPATEAPVTAPPPAATAEPNCSVSCNIAMEGDSLTVGLGNRLCGAVKTGNCINSGIVGRRVDEMIVTARTDIDNQVGSESNDVLILWGGTNDLWQKFHATDPAANAAAIYEQIKIFVAERRASGWDYVYVMTLPPMNPTYVVGTEPLNELIRQNGAAANGVLDVGADPRLANAFDPAMRAPDGIHFGDGGRAVVMEYIFGAIAELDGV